MQALSQLSYGPTMLEAEFYADVKPTPSLFSETPKKNPSPLRGRVPAWVDRRARAAATSISDEA
ncbi:hypothetical protein [Stenotrophomonas sp.]|uniref:hypothetical protein n=1 Tax=Stenotrophomonas sp. TaxID=69392 RepID=UPI002FC9828D